MRERSASDIVADVDSEPGEILRLLARDTQLASMLFTIGDDTGAGSTYLRIYVGADPGEPLLGDLVTLAASRARTAGLASVRWGGAADLPLFRPLQERHGFVVHDLWRWYHVDTATSEIPHVP